MLAVEILTDYFVVLEKLDLLHLGRLWMMGFVMGILIVD
jgi:hypothetical protein